MNMLLMFGINFLIENHERLSQLALKCDVLLLAVVFDA